MCIKFHADSMTLPSGVLQPDFTGNADTVDTDDVFAPMSSRKSIVGSRVPSVRKASRPVSMSIIAPMLYI